MRKLSEKFYRYAYLFLADFESLPEEWKMKEGFESEYRKLVERAGVRLPALWESCYRNGTRRLLDKYTLAVQKAYEQSGIQIRSLNGNEPADYIGYECLFVSFQAFMMEWSAENVAENHLGKAFWNANLLQEFCQKHLKVFLEGIQEELKKSGEYPVFLGIFEEMLKDTESLCEILEKGIAGVGQKALSAKEDGVLAEKMQSIDCTIIEWKKQCENIENLSVDVRVDSTGATAGHISDITAKRAQTLCHRTAGCWNNCGSSCLKEVESRDGCVLKVRSARTDEPQADRLTTCVRGLASAETFLTADRLRYPLLRTGKRGSGEYKRISWKEAIERICAENNRIRDSYGPASRYIAYSTGVVSLIRPDKVLRRFLNLDGGFLEFYNDYSEACIEWATQLMYGTSETGNSAEDLLNANLILVWGYNPLETGFGPKMRKMIARAKKKGIRIIVIDPRCSDTADYADEWIPLRPATDGALAAAMAYVIISEGLHDIEFLHKYCSGFDKETMPKQYRNEESFEDYILGKRDGIPKTPEWAEQITGVPKEKISELAHLYTSAKPAALLQGYGPQRHANGEQTARMITVLSCLCGNIGISGGRCGAQDGVARPVRAYFPTGEQVYPGQIPCYLWTQAVEDGVHMKPVKDGLLGVTELESNIKMLWCLGGNTLINQHGDINKTKKILENESLCEFIVCSDLFMTPSAMYADIILPGASCYEVDNITPAWQEGDFLLYNRKIVEPLFEGRFEYEWIRELAEMTQGTDAVGESRIRECFDDRKENSECFGGGREGVLEQFDDGKASMEEWLRYLYGGMRESNLELPSYEDFRTAGIAKYKERPSFIAFEKQINDTTNNPFPTYSGKIDFFVPYIYHLYEENEIAPIPKYQPSGEGIEELPEDASYFQLIGWHTKVRTHSCHDNNIVLQKKEPQGVWIHPEDAEKLEIADGEEILLENDRGRVKVHAKVTERAARRVLALSQGVWYEPEKDGTDKRGSINVLTSLKPTPLAKGNPQHTNIVRVRKISS